MPIKYLPYVPDTVSGQAILDNFTRARRVLRYRDNDKVVERLRRGLPLYETSETEIVQGKSTAAGSSTPPPSSTPNLLLRGECLSACAYLKANDIEIDLVYIDPPFASGADYAKSVYLRRHPHKAQEIESAEAELEMEELRAFEEKMYGDIWNKESYLNWMFENLHAIKSVMSQNASIYVHLDWHIGHYVKVLMDEVFGEDNFVNEIIWHYGGPSPVKTSFARKHDTILVGQKSSTSTFNPQYGELPDYLLERARKDEDGRLWVDQNLGKLTPVTIDRMKSEGRIFVTATGNLRRKQYLDEMEGDQLDDVWDLPIINSQAIESVDYATQKPEALLERIIRASSNEHMIVADFFGGSGVTAKVAHDLGRRFVHVDVGVNSLQTARDRLRGAGASFHLLDIRDGVSLFRNPVQTMDKLKSLIVGLKNEDGLDKFWEGAIADSKLGTVPVYLPNLLDHTTKVLDVPLINRVINEAMPDLPEQTKSVIVYYVDIFDEGAVVKYIKEQNMTGVEIELRDLKEVLDEVVLNDEAEYSLLETDGVWEIEIQHFASDRLQMKIDEYNQKRNLTGNAPPLQISDNGLELIEWLSLDCANGAGAWHSDVEIKIDKKGFVMRDGAKSKDFWDAKITSKQKPLRLKIRNIAGDESVWVLEGE